MKSNLEAKVSVEVGIVVIALDQEFDTLVSSNVVVGSITTGASSLFSFHVFRNYFSENFVLWEFQLLLKWILLRGYETIICPRFYNMLRIMIPKSIWICSQLVILY